MERNLQEEKTKWKEVWGWNEVGSDCLCRRETRSFRTWQLETTGIALSEFFGLPPCSLREWSGGGRYHGTLQRRRCIDAWVSWKSTNPLCANPKNKDKETDEIIRGIGTLKMSHQNAFGRTRAQGIIPNSKTTWMATTGNTLVYPTAHGSMQTTVIDVGKHECCAPPSPCRRISWNTDITKQEDRGTSAGSQPECARRRSLCLLR